MMDKMTRAFAGLRPKLRKDKGKRLFFFYKNGGLVLEDLIASFGARYDLPVRSFTAEEIIRATKNFSEQVRQTKIGDMFTGNTGKRVVLVQFYNGLGKDSRWNENASNRIIRDIVMGSQMRHLRNVLQLIGCCLEFEYPAMVYCYAPGDEFLVDCLNRPADDSKEKLSWRSRIKIVSDVANVLLYLHTAFSTPIIFGNLTIDKVIIDQFGAAKLFDFGLSISLPPGELKVENQLRWADVYSDPQCFKSYFVTQKTDVHSLGVLMLMLLTGETDTIMYHTGIKRLIHIRKYVKGYLDNDQLNQIVDPKIMEVVGDNCVRELEQQLLAFLDLAFRCTEHEQTSRPDMIDVAKELRQMEKSVYRFTSSTKTKKSFMEQIIKVLPCLKPRKEKEEDKLSRFFKNGSSILEEVIASFGGRYKLPIQSFAAEELIKATNKFSERVRDTNIGDMFAGNLKERPVLVKFYSGQTKISSWNETAPDRIIRDIVVTSQVSHLKNVLQLIGCCLEFEYPAMVYDYAPGSEFLSNRLRHRNNDGKLLSWKNRLTIATGIANVLLYLHTAFSTPIIFGNLTINKVIIDQRGVAKLFDFGLSISLPPGKSEVENQLKWIHVLSGPQGFKSNIVTLKSDVYNFGVLMLMLFTGETDAIKYDEEMGGRIYIQDYVKSHILNNQFNQIVDPNMFKQQGNYNELEVEQQLHDFLDLAFRCTEHDRADRPDMIEVAKELRQMEKSVRYS